MNSFKLVVNLILAYDESPSTLAPPAVAGESEPSPHEDDDQEEVHDPPVYPRSLVTSYVVMVLLFFPNYLIVQPMLFLWWLLSHLWHPFKGDSTVVVAVDNAVPAPPPSISRPNHSRSPLVETFTDTESVSSSPPPTLPASSIADSVKLSTLPQKYMFPPPLRLFPLSRNPQRRKQKKKLILDLDETLIHSLQRRLPRLALGGALNPKMIEIQLNGLATLYYVYKRPHVDYFLLEISKWFELQVFTASVQEYADPIIDWLETTIREKRRLRSDEQIFTKRYYRNHCTLRRGVGYIKDLSKFFASDELKLVVILDNSPVLYALHEDNAIMIEGWINDQHDRDLLNLLPMLRSLLLCIDVRYILGLRGGEKVFE